MALCCQTATGSRSTASCLTRLREHELNGKATGDAQASHPLSRLGDVSHHPHVHVTGFGRMAIRQSCIFGELAVPRMMPSVSCAVVGGIRFACLAPVPLSGHPMSAENSTALRKMGKPSVPDRRAGLATGVRNQPPPEMSTVRMDAG